MSEPIRYAIPRTLAQMSRDAHHVVEASAGTGKTFLIEHRVVDLLLRTECTIDQLLIVTFTEKATAELRMRIRRLLDTVLKTKQHTAEETEPHWLIDSDARHRLAGALFNFDAAPIHTIHGFCQRVLVDNAFDNRRLFDQSQVASQTAFAGAFRSALRERFARDQPYRNYLAAWLRQGKNVPALERLLFDCSQQPGQLVPVFDADRLQATLAAAADSLVVDDDFATALSDAGVPAATVRKVLRCAGAVARLVGGYADHGDIARFIVEVEQVEKGCLGYLDEKLTGVTISDETYAGTVDNILALAAGVVPFAAAIAQLFVADVQERMTEGKAQRGLFDFNDMLRLVWLSLDDAGADALLKRIRDRYRHALIDEFQDTDELQWKIFRRLYLEAPSGGESPHTLCIIGDPKQAIYSFRGADVVTYLGAREEIVAAGGSLVRLQENFRSTPQLVAANHMLMAERLGVGFFEGRIEYDEDVVAATDLVARDANDQPIAPIQVVQLVAKEKVTADGLRRRLVTYIKDEINGLLNDPSKAIRVSSEKSGKTDTVEAKDIFVLTRSLAEADEIADSLRGAGIPCALYKQEGLFQTAEAAQVRDLLAGIADPRHRSARFRAWQTRFFGVSLADLPALAELPETHPLVARLYEWKALATRLAYEELFSRIITDSGIVERELFLQPSERGLTNYLHLFELLLEQVINSRCELHELVHRLQSWMDNITETAGDARNIQRLDSDRSAVQIMTVHKAKGLEAKVVFLYGGFGRSGWRSLNVFHDESRRLVHIGPAKGDIKRIVDAEAREEDQRLMYVALTRAVARTYVPFIEPGLLRRGMGFYGQLNARLVPLVAACAANNAEVTPLFSVEQITETAPRAKRAAWLKPALEAWQPPAELLAESTDNEHYGRCRNERRGFVVTSYTRLKRNSAAPVDANEFKEDLASAPVELADHELPGGATAGIFLHHVLEHVPFGSVLAAPEFADWRNRDDVAPLFGDSMLRHGQDGRYRKHSERMVFDAITSPVSLGDRELTSLAHSDNVLREIEFLYPTAGSSRETFVKGFIDLVFEHAGRVYLLDWKSDVLAEYEAKTLRAHVAEHYRVQATLYTIALAKMLGLGDEKSYEGRFGGVVYTFLRGGSHHFERPSYAELRSAEANLAKGQLR